MGGGDNAKWEMVFHSLAIAGPRGEGTADMLQGSGCSGNGEEVVNVWRELCISSYLGIKGPFI